MVPYEWSFRFTLYTQGSLSKGQSFSLEASGVSLEFSWGSLFLCEKSPSRSTRNSPNSVWGSRFSGAVPCHSLSVDWRGSDIPACLGTNLHFRWGTVRFMEELEAWENLVCNRTALLFWPSGWTNTVETKLTWNVTLLPLVPCWRPSGLTTWVRLQNLIYLVRMLQSDWVEPERKAP